MISQILVEGVQEYLQGLSKKGAVLNKPLKHTFEYESSSPIISREVDHVGKTEKGIGK